MAPPGADEAKARDAEIMARDAQIDVELARMAAGSRGVVVRVESAFADAERLQALGLCEGRRVEVLRAGDPLIVKVHGSRFGLAAARASGIRVRLDRSAGEPRG